MHGRPRKCCKEEDSAIKVSNLRFLQSKLLYNHHNSIYTDEAIDLSSKLLQINPDFYTLWNYRKLALQHKLQTPDPSPLQPILHLELLAVHDALYLNPKSYPAWHHRRWLLARTPHPPLHSEMLLLNRFLKLDPRNFHAWNHRRFLSNNFDSLHDDDDFFFTTSLLDSDFSNYSAWHSRTLLLPTDGFSKAFSSELDFVHHALFTDPDDQSAWFYHLWILGLILRSHVVVLVSSYPENGTRIKPPHDSTSLPLVLHFSHVVEGVDSNTVNINSPFVTNEWTPLSSISSTGSKSWGCFLNFTSDSSTNHLVEIAVGFSKGIVSVSGSDYSDNHIISFTILGISDCFERAEDVLKKEISDDSAYFSSTLCLEPKSIDPKHDDSPAYFESEDMLKNEISLFRELLSVADSKFAKLASARLLVKSDAMAKGGESTTHCLEEVLNLYEELIETDALRSGCYRDERSSAVGPRESNSGKNSTRTVVMSGLSLSRVGGVGRMLWVEVLDLGRNDIRSIEGLEALQLLKSIDLSYNKIGSFSALGPLAFSKSLRVLNISHNEIGSHSVDTARFSCGAITSRGRGFRVEDGRGFREARAVFEGMGLKRLDIFGNPISSSELKRLLVDLLPSLEWIDGEKTR